MTSKLIENNDVAELCLMFADLLKESKHCVFYTGAGISTPASIPDYRSPSGLYEQFKASGSVPTCVDITGARPVFTHMAMKALVDTDYVQHIVSQNCDGLHLRSGLASERLSEIHGNMFVEMCLKCDPPTPHIRHFDTTEGTRFRQHKVANPETRPCTKCGSHEELYDSIVHCGEYARFEAAPPYRWPEAGLAAQETDLIVCVGTSLAVLKSYSSLWAGLKRRGGKPRAKLVIINLQPTVKDKQATLVISENCENVFRVICRHLSVTVPEYDAGADPIHRARFSPDTIGHIGNRSLVSLNQVHKSPTATMPGWMRATVQQLRRAKEKNLRSRRSKIFGSRKRGSNSRSKRE